MKLINIIPIHLLLFLHCTHATFLPKDGALNIPRDARGISSDNRIKWTRCNLGIPEYKELEKNKAFECGTLTVPLDYTRKYSSNTTTLNLIKLKATEKSTEKAPKGSIIMNFGGPGASGVDGLLNIPPDLTSLGFGGQYDLISFDPRTSGTGKTLVPPGDEGFLTQTVEELVYTVQNSPSFLSRDVFDYISTFTEIFVTGDEEFRAFRGTAFVARDIAEIASALGEGNRINYYGASYGTVLGQVLAGMFPDRIERMVLDGNLLADDYVNSLGLDSIRDAKKALYHFYDECMAAPNNTCHSANKLPKERDDFLKVLNHVFIVCTGVGGGLGRTKSLSLTDWVFRALYGLGGYLELDELIDTALEGNRSRCPQVTDRLIKTTTPWNPRSDLAHLAIFCTDTTFRAENIEDFDLIGAVAPEVNDSPFFLPVLLTRSACSRWNTYAAEGINLTSLSRVETKNPILLVNGEYDPVTPLSHAQKISARFPGSQVVVHKGVGHTVFAHPSNCTLAIVAGYFLTGLLPPAGTTCEPILGAFEGVERLRGKGTELTRKRNIPILL
ncbi:alpha beta hydrolase superfamily hydrolase [Fusarium denticulatum]|uniref:Alpha beta hydrolase superfamily hydrolase n=1 Tax=Fusarium denticulatum TaxID=48507 RepID=A0A8H5XL46_9HYPO|nr:alpha beta hydrolase superfamily hydrolase [Fusarium denticulatum]